MRCGDLATKIIEDNPSIFCLMHMH